MPHAVLYFLLAEQVVVEITVPLSLHVINCLFLDILLCSYLWSFSTSLFSLKNYSVTLLFTTFPLLYHKFTFSVFCLLSPTHPLDLPTWLTQQTWKIHSDGKTKLVFPTKLFKSQQYPRTGPLDPVFPHRKEFLGAC